MESMIDKLKQLEEKMFLKLLPNHSKWKYILTKDPVEEWCATVVGNYTIILSFNHINPIFEYNQVKAAFNSATHVLYGNYEISTDEAKSFMISMENSPCYYQLQSGATICFKPVKEVSASVSLEERQIDLEHYTGQTEDLFRKEIMLEW